MPAPKKPGTFDAHVGAVVGGLAKPHGGRPFLATLLDLSEKTMARRVTGENGFTIKELYLLSDALHATPESIVDQALRNYGDGDARAGYAKLQAEGETSTADVGGPHEDNYEVTPGGTRKADLALAANKRRRKVDTAPYAE